MAPVYALTASRAHENVLCVVGHAYHFMGHDLADGENEIEVAMHNEPVYLCRPRIVQLAFRLLADELGRDLAKGLDVRTPIMHAEKLCRHGAKNSCELLRFHRSMRAEGRQDRLEPVAEIFPGEACQVAGARMHAALIRWHDENPVAFSKLHKTFHEQIVQLLQG